MFGLTSRDHRFDTSLPDEPTVLVVVVAAVSDHAVGAPSRPADPSAYGRYTVEQGRDAVVVIDSLDALPAAAARRTFGAGRNTDEAGSLTVLASTGTVAAANLREWRNRGRAWMTPSTAGMTASSSGTSGTAAGTCRWGAGW